MKASRLIELLQKTIENHGDLDVLAYNRSEECDGKVQKVQVKTYEGEMPYYCKGDSVVDIMAEDEDLEGTEFVVLFND